MKANRIVLPIQPGTHWSEAKPIVLPGMENANGAKALPDGDAPKPKREKKPKAKKPAASTLSECNGLRFGPPPESLKPAKEKPAREKPATKNDPQLVAAAREFRDRYLEEVNSGRCLLQGDAKYDVSRPPQLAAGSSMRVMEHMPAAHPSHLLNAA